MAKYILSSKIEKNMTLFDENLKSYRLISSALATCNITKDFTHMETKNLLNQTIRELNLSEIETVVWIIILDRIGWNNYNFPLKTFLCLTGLQCKISLGMCVQSNVKRFVEKMPNIDKDLKLWCSDHPVYPEITVNDINQKYNNIWIQSCNNT